MEERFEKVQKLLEDEAFIERLEKCGTLQEAQALFASNGAELLEDEVLQLGQTLVSAGGAGELDEGALDSVAGGRLNLIPALYPIRPVPVIPWLRWRR